MTGSLSRIAAVFIKEITQLRRDRLTFAMMVLIPVMQLLLFGYAINTDPRKLPTAVVDLDGSQFSRSFLSAMQETGYFEMDRQPRSEKELDDLFLAGKVQFGVQIPPNFGRDIMRGENPALLVIADATDPSASGNAIAALQQLPARVFTRDLQGAGHIRDGAKPPFELRLHRRYNPTGETSFNIVPGLMGTILTLTMLLFTGLSVTREVERGTMETLLSLPIRPVEIMLGKIAPYVVVGAIQMTIILSAGFLLFGVPLAGSLPLLLVLTTLFICANLAVGYTFSTIATSQLQAMQMSFFFLMPSILLSGFAFPFRGMPGWAQVIGEVLPATHFLRIVRGLMLKAADLSQVSGEIAVLSLMLMIVSAVAISRYKVTLD